MLKRIMFNSSKIAVKQVTSSQVITSGYSAFTSTNLYFVKVNLAGLATSSVVNKATLRIDNTGTIKDKEIEIIDFIGTADSDTFLKRTFSNYLSSTTVNTILKIDVESGKSKYLDLTKLVKNQLISSSYDNYLRFIVRTNNTNSSFQLNFDTELELIYTNSNERNYFNQRKSFDLGFAGELNVDLLDGKLIQKYPLMSTFLSKTKLAYPIFLIQSNLLSQEELGNGISGFFTNINISSNNSKIVITSYDGQTKEYRLLTTNSASNLTETEQQELTKKGIKLINIKEGVWFCDNDLTYISKYESNDTNSNPVTIIEIFDQQNNKYGYWYYSNNQRAYLREYISFKEDSITFNYNSSLMLTKMINNFNEELEFTYSIVNNKTMLTKITNNSSKDTLNITYDTSNRISTMSYLYKGVDSNYYYYTKKVTFTYNGSLLISISDNSSRNKVDIIYSDEKVSRVEIKNIDTNKLIDKVTFAYFEGKYTQISDFRGNTLTYLFNSYGQCVNVFDNHKRYLASNYDPQDGGLNTHLTEKSKVQFIDRNLIFNNSFENTDVFSEYGWSLDSGDESMISKDSNGVSGESCLKIHKTTNTPIIISQIASIPPEIESKTITSQNRNIALSGYVKCLFEDPNLISANDLMIKAVVSCIDRSDQSFTWKPTQNIEEWCKFLIKGDIQEGSTVSKIELFIELKGQNCKVYLDDLQLCSGKKQDRYNVVSNGYFDKFDITRLPLCWTQSNFVDGDKLEYTVLDSSHPSYLGRYAMKFMGISLLTTSLEDKKKSINQTINIKGLKNDRLVFSAIGKGQFSNDSNIYVNVKFHYLDGTDEIIEFKFLENIEDWQLLTKELVANEDYNKVTITISSTSVNDCYIDAIQLYKDSFGTHYSYNEMHSIESITSEDGTSMIIRYGDNNQVEEIITNNGEWFKIAYGTNKEISTIKDHLGNTISYTYDSNRNCTSNTLTTKDNKKIIKQFTYDTQGLLCIEEIDELGNVKKYSYDNNSTTNKHGLLTSSTINDAHLTYYGYTEALLPSSLRKVVNSQYHSNYFTYTNKRENSGVYNNKSSYQYTYDDYGKLLTIKVDNELYCSNEYENSTSNINHNVITKQTFEDGTIITYTYDNEDNIESKSINGALNTEFQYNENSKVSEVNDHLENQKYSFDYTSDGKIKKVIKENKGFINYGYDNLGNLQKSSLNIEGINKSYDFIYKNELSDKNLSYYYIKLAEKFSDDLIVPGSSGKSLFGSTPKVNTVTYKNDSEFNDKVYAFNNSSDYLWYDLTSFNSSKSKFAGAKEFDKESWLSQLNNSKVFYMWVKPTGTFKETRLFTFQKITDTENEMLSSVVITSQGKLAYKNLSSNTTLVTSTNSLTLNKWNFVGVHMNTLPVVGTLNTKEYVRLTLNGEDTSFVEMNEGISNINHLIVGLQDSSTWNEYSSSSSELILVTTFTFDVGLVGFGKRNLLESLCDIYQPMYNILYKEVKKENDGITYYNTHKSQDFEIFSLNGSFESNKGKQPFVIEKSCNMFNEVDNFFFDETINRQVFKCFENNNKMSHVGYELGLEDQGSILLRFKYEENTQIKPLISISNTTSENILVFIKSGSTEDEKDKLKIKVNNEELSTYFPIVENKWYEMILTMNSTSGMLYLKGFGGLGFSNSSNNFSDSIIKVGANKDNTLSLNGYIERLGIAKEYLSSSELSNILEGNVDVVLRDEYDGIGRITSKHLFVNNLEFNKSYTYKSIDGLQKTSTLIEKETLIDGRSQEYEYDAYGNVTKKTIKSSNNIVEEEYTYTYDTLFRLTEEEIVTYSNNLLDDLIINKYTYDNNGNRISVRKEENGTLIGTYSYEYDDVHKDRLIRYNDDLNQEILIDISYEDSFYKPSLMVIDGENNNLTWQGRNLMSQDLFDVTYTYNSSGLRTSKQVNNVLTNYIYEGSKLIGKKVLENNVETTLIYNYDHHNKIMGLSINDKEYFYIKDILENIIGIIDQERNVVVYYRYDAYGKLLQEDIKINNLASKYNDILYKGYVYDRESELYYLKSRYYSPRIGRFIIMDEVSYVNPKDINGLNLYAYCNNNPIMYYDPSGRFVIVIMALAAVAGAIIGAHIENAYLIDKAEKKAKKTYTREEADIAIEQITGEGTVEFEKSYVFIKNSCDIKSKEDRIYISTIIANTVDEEGNKLTDRSVYSLSAEWRGHNILSFFNFRSTSTDHVNLDYDFSENETLTKAGTVLLMILGWL